MIRVTFKPYLDPFLAVPVPRDIDADNVYYSTDGEFVTFERYREVEGQPYRDSEFVEAIRANTIEGMVRVDP